MPSPPLVRVALWLLAVVIVGWTALFMLALGPVGWVVLGGTALVVGYVVVPDGDGERDDPPPKTNCPACGARADVDAERCPYCERVL